MAEEDSVLAADDLNIKDIIIANGVICDTKMEACFTSFDKDGDGLLNQTEFNALCRALFRNDRGRPYAIETKMLSEMFNVFDKNEDGFIDREEFNFCWHQWIKTVVRPVSALVVVDVQNDFISGSLAIDKCPAQHNGEDVVEPINNMLNNVSFDHVFYSLDWHPHDHVSFIDNVANRKIDPSSKVDAETAQTFDTVIFEGPPLNEQKLWPTHCVQESWGAELHKDLKITRDAVYIYKGTNPDVDSYSAFWDNNKLSRTPLSSELKKRKVTDVYICGIAYDVCVAATTFHALEFGYRTILLDDACRGILNEDIQKTKTGILEQNGVIVHSSQVNSMVQGRDRHPVLGYSLAKQLAKKP